MCKRGPTPHLPMFADIRISLRKLWHAPGYAVVALATLALGIGVNTAMFTILNTEIYATASVRESRRLIGIQATSQQSQELMLTPAEVRAVQKEATAYSSFVPYVNASANYAEPDQPAEHLMGLNVAADFLPMMGISPEIGRFFSHEEDNGGGSGAVALIGDHFWRSRFGGDPGVIGRSIRLDATPVTIIGVMPAQFDNPIYWGWGRVDIWRPLNYGPSVWQIRDNRWLSVIARLKPGISVEAARAETAAIAGRLAKDYPATNAKIGFRVRPWDRIRVNDLNRQLVWLLVGLSGFVLLIACANLANLQLARAAEQFHEHALRLALGASQFRLARQILIESLLVSVGGGLLGLLVAVWGTRIMASEIVVEDIAGLDMPVDMHVLAFCLGAAVGTGILFGIIPAFAVGRINANGILRQSGRGAIGGGYRQRVRQALVVGQFILTLALLAGAGFFIRGMEANQHRDMGWQPDGLVVGNLSLPGTAPYDSEANVRSFLDRLESKLREIPGTKNASISSNYPIGGLWSESKLSIIGQPAAKPGEEPVAYINPVSPNYFSTLGVRLLKGRFFDSHDRADGRQVAIVNEAMARQFWPDQDPIGKQIGVVGGEKPDNRIIVGVVRDIGQTFDLIRNPDTPFVVYQPFLQAPANRIQYYMWVAVRSSAPAANVILAIRRAVGSLDAGLSLASVQSANQAIGNMIQGFILVEQILGSFAVLGLVLAGVGLYGIVANSVARRTSEIGIRMALGAQVRDILSMVLWQGMTLAGVGSAVGLVGAWAVTRALESILPSIRGADSLWLGAVALMLVAVAFLATWIPARRAARIEPMVALRTD